MTPTSVVTPTRREAAREARRAFESVVDRQWNRRASLFLDLLTVLAEGDE